MVRLGGTAGTQNIDRILRLPGPTNLPNKKKLEAGRTKCPTALLWFNGASYDIKSFPLPEQMGPGTPDDGGHHAKANENEEKLDRVIRDGPDADEFKTRSHAVWFVINELLRRNCPDRAILSTILSKSNKISAHVYDQGDAAAYAKKQLTKAKEKFTKTKDGNKIEVLPESQYLGAQPAPIPPALIKGVLPQTGVAIIGGQSGTGKTFQAIHLGVRFLPDCRQSMYIDKYRIKRHGGVLYLVLEGRPAFPLRVTMAVEQLLGSQMKFGDRSRQPFCWNTYEPHLFKNGSDGLIGLAQREAAMMKRDFGVDLVAIMLDTMGLAACYENENMAAQVQEVISGLFRLSNETGALAIGVDHVGKDQNAGLRGSSAKRGHAETVLTCMCDRDQNNNPEDLRMWFEKVRDGEEGRVIPYRLKVVDCGVDEDHDRVTTCVIEWEPNKKLKAKKQPKRRKTSVPLKAAIDEVGLPGDKDKLREAFYRHHGGSQRTANQAWNRAIQEEGLVLNGGKLDYE
jgi:hypothetical protein